MSVLGPLEANGFGLAYFDGAGNRTSTPATVRQIRVTLLGPTNETGERATGEAAATLPDTLVALVTLRNGS